MIYIFAPRMVEALYYARAILRLEQTGPYSFNGANILSSPEQLLGFDGGEFHVINQFHNPEITSRMVEAAKAQRMEVKFI